MTELPSRIELPSREDTLTAYHQADLDDPMRPLLYRYASGRLVDRESIDPCPGKDPACPGHDHGDPCHYRSVDGDAALGVSDE